MRTKLFILSTLVLVSVASFSQLRKIPPAVKESFSEQYPEAEEVNWKGDFLHVSVKFMMDNKHMSSKYSNKGTWKYTEEETTFEEMPASVKDGFRKSKYADRMVQEVDVVHYPDDVIHYRIKAGRNAVEKKFLYFSPEGQLVKEGITI
jgi:hypothetical protein